MTGNTFGKIFKVTTFGESHGTCVGCVIDGCPSNLEISENDIQKELDRRRPGQSNITTSRNEADKVQIMSGVFEGKTTGTPIMLLVYNKDYRSRDYSDIKDIFRPSHGDFVYQEKYGIRDYRGGGRSSARETIGRVAAGAVAKKFLEEKLGIEILSFTQQVATIKAENIDLDKVTIKDIESNIVRCPDNQKAKEMIELISKVKEKGDSIGGIVQGVIRNVPAGLGEPVFDKLSAELSKAIFSINAVKGFEIGEGFNCVNHKGSEFNDEFYVDKDNKKIRTKTNHSGGIQAGISNGENITFRVAFKPTATIQKEQQTVNLKGEEVTMKASGRHDPCVVPRAIPIVDSMTALVLIDAYFLNVRS